ncbi:MAG: VTT domain-containing protein [Proteobacteria bacterium]|nr:VTT domain-containing protein [Pseudomonadota bacterium]
MQKKILIKAILLLSILVFSIFFTIKYNILSIVTDQNKLIAFVNSFKTLSVFIFILLQIIQVIIAFVPGEVTGFIGGYLFGTLLGTIYSTIGLTLGSIIAFYLARVFGRPLVLFFVKQEYLKRFDYLMTHKGTSISAFLFLMPGFPKDYLCYILGLSKMTPRVFIIISTFGRIMSTFLLSIGGSLIRHEHYKTFITLAVVVLIIIGFFYIYREKIENKLKKVLQKYQ